MLKKILLTLFLLSLAFTAVADSFKVSDILVDGNDRVEKSSILATISIKPGDQVTLDDVDQAMHDIFSLGRFDDISAEMSEVNQARIITFVVKELPLVRDIRLAGRDAISEEKLRGLLTVRAPELYNRAKVNKSIEEMLKAYTKEGYHAAKITPQIEVDERNQATLTFNIEEGEKILVGEIKFIGNQVVDADDLKDAMETQEHWWLSWLTGRGVYQDEIMQVDLERLKEVYQDLGYMDVKVAQPKVTLTEDQEYLDVLIEISEGPQYRVGSIDIRGDLLKPKDELGKLVKLKNGDIFNRSLVREDVLRLTDLYADSGYANVNIAPLPNRDKVNHIIDLTLDIDQGIKVYIENINIHGNTKTRDKVIRRELPIIEGDEYSASKIKEGNRNLRNLGFFDEVNLTTHAGSDPSQTELNIDVKERPTGTFSFGVGYSSVDQFLLQGAITQDNFLGYGIRLNLSGAYSSKSTTYSLGVTDPHFLDTDWTLGGELYNTEREYSAYDIDRSGGSITAGHRLSKYSKWYLTYRYEVQDIIIPDDSRDRVSKLILDQEGISTLSSITTDFVRNSTDYHQDPSSGGISKLSIEYTGLGGSEHFAKIVAEHRHFFPVFWGTVFSVHGEIGFLTPTGKEEVPLAERFYLGGLRSIRGFKTREVGPKDGDDFIGGEKESFFNLEYLFPISKDLGLKGVLFYDGGNAWLDNEDYFTNMRYSVGAGVRWLSPLGPLRFEWGYNLDPQQDEQQSVFEFSIGTAF